MACPPAQAGDWTVATEVARPEYQYETWAGADGSATSWSAWGGFNTAIFGDVRENGPRLRTSGGYGRYRYQRPVFDPFRRRLVWVEFHGEMQFNDLLLGYQQAFGHLIVKGYVGVTEERHRLTPGPASILAYDAENKVQGTGQGIKLALETWVRLAEWGFVQSDLNWSQTFEAYSSRLRLGYRLNPAWSTGVEAAVFGNANHDQGRAGAFLRFEWSQGEVSLATGAGGDTQRHAALLNARSAGADLGEACYSVATATVPARPGAASIPCTPNRTRRRLAQRVMPQAAGLVAISGSGHCRGTSRNTGEGLRHQGRYP